MIYVIQTWDIPNNIAAITSIQCPNERPEIKIS